MSESSKVDKSIVKDLMIIYEVLRKGFEKSLVVNPFISISDDTRNALVEYLTFLSDEYEKSVKYLKERLVNTEGVSSLSEAEKQRQKSLVLEKKEDIEGNIEHKSKSAEDSFVFYLPQTIELEREVKVCSQILNQNENAISLKQAEELTRYLPAIFDDDNLKTLVDIAYSQFDGESTKPSILLKSYWDTRLSKYNKGDGKPVYLKNEAINLVNIIDERIKQKAYVAVKRTLSEVLGRDALLEMEGINKAVNTSQITKENLLMNKVNENGGLDSVSGFEMYCDFLQNVSNWDKTIDKVEEGKIKYCLSTLKYFFNNEKKEKTLLHSFEEKEGEALKDRTKQLCLLLSLPFSSEPDINEKNIKQKIQVLGSRKNIDIFLNLSRKNEYLRALSTYITDEQFRVFEEDLRSMYSDIKLLRQAKDSKTYFSIFVEKLKTFGITDNNIIFKYASLLSEDFFVANLSRQVISNIPSIKEELKNADSKKDFSKIGRQKFKEVLNIIQNPDYGDVTFDSYLKIRAILNRPYEELFNSSLFLCAKDRANSYPGFRHFLISENIVKPEFQPIVGNDLSFLISYYFTLFEYVRKIQALPIQYLKDEDKYIKDEVSSRFEKKKEEIIKYRENIKEYFDLPKELIREDLEKNLKGNLNSITTWYRENNYKMAAKFALMRGLKELATCSIDDDIVKKHNRMQNNWEFLQNYKSFQKYVCFVSILGLDLFCDKENKTDFDYFNYCIHLAQLNHAWPSVDIVKAKAFIKRIICDNNVEKTRMNVLELLNKRISEQEEENKYFTLNFEDIYFIVQGIESCEKSILDVQLDYYKSYLDTYVNPNNKNSGKDMFDICKENFELMEEKIYTDSDSKEYNIVQLFGYLGEKANKAQVEALSAYINTFVAENKEETLKEIQAIIAKSICERGLRIAEITNLEKQIKYTTNPQDKKRYSKLYEQLDVENLNLGRSYIGSNSAVYLVDFENVINLLEKEPEYKYACEVSSLERNGLISHEKAIDWVASSLKESIHQKIIELEQSLMQCRVFSHKACSQDIQYQLVLDMKNYEYEWALDGSDIKEYPWSYMLEIIEKVKENNPFEDTKSIEDAIYEKDLISFRKELVKLTYASPTVKYTLDKDPQREKGNWDRFLKRGSEYLKEKQSTYLKQEAVISERIKQLKRKEENCRLMAQVYLAFDIALIYERYIVKTKEIEEKIKLLNEGLTSLDLNQIGLEKDIVHNIVSDSIKSIDAVKTEYEKLKASQIRSTQMQISYNSIFSKISDLESVSEKEPVISNYQKVSQAFKNTKTDSNRVEKSLYDMITAKDVKVEENKKTSYINKQFNNVQATTRSSALRTLVLKSKKILVHQDSSVLKDNTLEKYEALNSNQGFVKSYFQEREKEFIPNKEILKQIIKDTYLSL